MKQKFYTKIQHLIFDKGYRKEQFSTDPKSLLRIIVGIPLGVMMLFFLISFWFNSLFQN